MPKSIDEVTQQLLNLLNSSNPDIVAMEELILDGADLTTASESGVTALMVAVVKRSPHLVKLCLENGAKVDAASKKSGITSLMHAAKLNLLDIAVILLEAGADPTIMGNFGVMKQKASDYATDSNLIRVLTEAERKWPDRKRSDPKDLSSSYPVMPSSVPPKPGSASSEPLSRRALDTEKSMASSSLDDLKAKTNREINQLNSAILLLIQHMMTRPAVIETVDIFNQQRNDGKPIGMSRDKFYRFADLVASEERIPLTDHSPHSCAALLKKLLSGLGSRNAPLISDETYEKLKRNLQPSGLDDLIEPQQSILKALIELLSKIAAKSDKNHMTPELLANQLTEVFTKPTGLGGIKGILEKSKTLATLIQNHMPSQIASSVERAPAGSPDFPPMMPGSSSSLETLTPPITPIHPNPNYFFHSPIPAPECPSVETFLPFSDVILQAVTTAYNIYEEFLRKLESGEPHLPSENRGHEIGFMTKFRHGAKGLEDAKTHVKNISMVKDSSASLIASIHHILSTGLGRASTHSFVQFLMDALFEQVRGVKQPCLPSEYQPSQLTELIHLMNLKQTPEPVDLSQKIVLG
jgi:hypothetical protein